MDTLDILTDFIDKALLVVGALFVFVKILPTISRRRAIMTLDDIFRENKELPYVSSVPWGKKKYEKAIHAKQVSQSVWYGTVTQGKRTIGRWIWDTNRFFSPVFISSIAKVNGKPKRYTKLPVCEAIKKMILAEIEKQKEERNNAEKTA